MKRSMWFTTGLGAGAVALVAAAGLVAGSPAFAQSANPPAATPNAQTAPGMRGGRGFGGGFIGRGGANIATVAKALNMTEVDLRTELQSGKSIADVAAAKNVSLDTIVSAIVADQTTMLKQAVTDGKLTQAQADTMLANLKLTLPSQLQVKYVAGIGGDHGFGGPGGDHGGRGGFGGRGGASFTVVAKALTMTEADLRTQVQAGKTIADVAKAKNVDLSTISAALLADEKTRVTQAVTDGKLTQAQADQKLADAPAHITAFLNGTMSQRGPGRGHGGEDAAPGAAPQATPKPSA